MRVRTFREKFKSVLAEKYPKTEIETFFNLLLENYVDLTRLELVLHPEIELNSLQKKQLEEALNRLQNYEPVQYIIGKTEFYGLDFKVNEDVLIPRPETEELVRWIVKNSTSKPTAPLSSLLDIGTGSGCIAVSLAKNLPRVKIYAGDISEKALKLAEENAKANAAEVHFKKMDILKLQPVPQKFDVIVSNPPYVRKLEQTEMRRNVLEHEPGLALFVEDNDALLFYRKILEFAKNHLTKNGLIYVEINQYLEEDLKDLLQQNGITDFEFKNDIFGNPRMLKIFPKKQDQEDL